MRQRLRLLMIGAAFGLCAFAQEWPVGDVFFGYSFVRANSARDIPAFTNNGGVGTLAINVNNHIAIEADFGGYHNGNINNKEADTTLASFLFGPRFSLGRSRTFDPYFHVLIGGSHISSSIAKSSVLLPQPLTLPAGSQASPCGDRYCTSQSNFAMAAGGGIDIRLTKYMLLRPVQVDYFLTRFQDLGFAAVLFGTPSQNRIQNNLRFAAGITFHFGFE